jgi:hypothetical protein
MKKVAKAISGILADVIATRTQNFQPSRLQVYSQVQKLQKTAINTAVVRFFGLTLSVFKSFHFTSG